MTRTGSTYTQGTGPYFMDVLISPATLKSGELLKRLDVKTYPKVGVKALADTTTGLVVLPAGSQAQAVTLAMTATVVSADFAGVIGGTVDFLDGVTVLATLPVVRGVAVYSGLLAAGSHSLTAVYSGGDSDHTASTSSAVVRTST